MIYFIAGASSVAVVLGLVLAHFFARRFTVPALRGGFVYAAFAIVTILLLQLIPFIFGREGGQSAATSENLLAVDSFAFVICLLMLTFSFCALQKKEKINRESK